jgi:site-specific recombinase XerC
VRRADLLRDKQRIVLSFFRDTGKLPSEVEPSDVRGGLRDLEGKGISVGTCYQHACLFSSFYSWAMKDPEVGQYVRRNPARLARPKAPKALPDRVSQGTIGQGGRGAGGGGAQAGSVGRRSREA